MTSCAWTSFDPCALVAKVVDTWQKTDKKIGFVSMQGTLSQKEDFGCDGHPSLIGAKKLADRLIQALEKAETLQ